MTTESGAPTPPSEEEEKRRRRPIAWWWWAAGGGALIAVILTVVMFAGDDADDAGDLNERVQAPTPGATTSPGGSTATEAPTASDSGGTAPDADAPDIEGVWEFIVTVTETSGVCAGEEDESPGIDNVTIRRLDDGSYSVTGLGTTPDSEWAGRWDGDRFVFGGEREEDDGTTVAEFTMTFEDSVFAGAEDWSWSDADGECPTGKSTVEAFFYAPLP